MYSALNVLGWVIVMPVLVVAAMSPFVNFSGLGGANGDEARAAQVAILPPRLSEHGSLPQLTEAPQPAAKVPVHRPILVSFNPAPAPTRSRPAPAARRRVASYRVSSPSRRRASTRVVRRPASSPTKPVQQARPQPSRPGPAQPAPSSRPDHPGRGNDGGKPDEPNHGQVGKPPEKPQDPQHGQRGKPPEKPQDPQHGQAGKPQDPQHGQGAGKPDDPQHGQAGKQDDPQRGEGRGRGAD